MMLFKHQARSESITDILENISEFEERMSRFLAKYPYYRYALNLTKDEDTQEWVADLNIERHEQTNNQGIDWDI